MAWRGPRIYALEIAGRMSLREYSHEVCVFESWFISPTPNGKRRTTEFPVRIGLPIISLGPDTAKHLHLVLSLRVNRAPPA